MKEPSLEEAEPDVILIENLRVPLHIGVHAFEHGQTQMVRFDLAIEAAPGYRDRPDPGESYISYADAVEFIREAAATGEHVRLVEEWAERVAAFVLRNEMVRTVTVSVLKTEIFEGCDGVGIRIVRRRA